MPFSLTTVHANFLNSQVHKLVNHQKSKSDDQSMKLAFDVEKYVDTVKSIASEMWEHVCNLTMSVNERKGRSASVKKSALTSSINRAYLVSLILFVTNSECISPFDIVVSDVIEACGSLSKF